MDVTGTTYDTDKTRPRYRGTRPDPAAAELRTDPISLVIIIIVFFFFFFLLLGALMGRYLQKSKFPCIRFKSDRDEIWHDCSPSKYASTDGVEFLM